MAELDTAAMAASARATNPLLGRLDSASLRTALRQLGAHDLASLQAQELLRRWREELGVAEIAHGFDTAPNFDDVDLAQLEALDFFPNQWQLEVLYPRNLSDPHRRGRYGVDGYIGTVAAAAAAEQSVFLYGLANFTGVVPSLPGTQTPFIPGNWPATITEASERMVYGVLNSHRIDFPTWKWGNAAVVFNSSAVADMFTLSPVCSYI